MIVTLDSFIINFDSLVATFDGALTAAIAGGGSRRHRDDNDLDVILGRRFGGGDR